MNRTAVIITLVLIAGAVTTFVVLDNNVDTVAEQSRDKDVLYTRTVARVVSGALEQEGAVLERLLGELPADLASAKDLSQRLTAPGGWLLEQGGVGLFDADLKLLAVDQRPAGMPPLPLLLPALRQARDATAPSATGLWIGRDEHPRVTVIRGVTHEGKWRAAMGHIRLDGPRFLASMANFLVDDRSSLTLLDGTGQVLYSTLPEERYGKALDAVHVRGAARRGETQPVGVTLHEGGHARPEVLTTVAAVGRSDWTVALHERQEVIEAAHASVAPDEEVAAVP